MVMGCTGPPRPPCPRPPAGGWPGTCAVMEAIAANAQDSENKDRAGRDVMMRSNEDLAAPWYVNLLRRDLRTCRLRTKCRHAENPSKRPSFCQWRALPPFDNSHRVCEWWWSAPARLAAGRR